MTPPKLLLAILEQATTLEQACPILPSMALLEDSHPLQHQLKLLALIGKEDYFVVEIS